MNTAHRYLFFRVKTLLKTNLAFMKRIIFILAVVILPFSCKKRNVDVSDIKGTMDLKGLSLPRLKAFLDGKWRLHRFVLRTIAGASHEKVPDSIGVFLIFYPNDSIKRETTLTNIIINEKLVYKYLKLPGIEGESSYVLMFDKDVYGYRNMWVADSLVNDTLIFTNYFQSEGLNRYYYTKIE